MVFSKQEIIEDAFLSLERIIEEKTNKEYAHTSMNILLKKLKHKFDFLNHVHITNVGYNIDKKINECSRYDICKAVEAFIRIVYMDLKDDAGIFFLRQIESKTRPGFIDELRSNGVDLDLLKIEHHVLFRNLNKLKLEFNKSKMIKNENESEIHKDTNFLIELEQVEKDFLKLLHNQDLYQEKIIKELKISTIDLNRIISRLLNFQFLQYLNDDEVTLTEKGIKYLKNYEKFSLER